MTNYIISFGISNLILTGITIILIIIKKLLKPILSARMQYALWLCFLVLLAAPFFPVSDFIQFQHSSSPTYLSNTSGSVLSYYSAAGTDWIHDFAVSVNTPSSFWPVLFCILWICGAVTVLSVFLYSQKHLRDIRRSAQPVTDSHLLETYANCMEETQISTIIPVYSTLHLSSPALAGLLFPCIYLPEYLLVDSASLQFRYVFLHELQHYKRKDNWINLLMWIARIVYWFHPLIWYALSEMQNERELACDEAVLSSLAGNEYTQYGETLLHFAEKSISPSFTSGINSTIKQMKARILHIASYHKPSYRQAFINYFFFIIIAIFFLCISPLLSVHASDRERYQWNTDSTTVESLELKEVFAEYEGSFVLYDSNRNSWKIYQESQALTRISPNSTYKIYDALLALESGIITPEYSYQSWDGTPYPFASWNRDQHLESAMSASVTWYFQKLDQQIGTSSISDFLKIIHYGNEHIDNHVSTYWLEGSLKISPVEQVLLLQNFYHNTWNFKKEHIETVKNSIQLSSTSEGNLYGKTGTGQINGNNVNGWFIGYIEKEDNTYFFATNIQNESNAAGSKAVEITHSILSDMNLWK